MASFRPVIRPVQIQCSLVLFRWRGVQVGGLDRAGAERDRGRCLSAAVDRIDGLARRPDLFSSHCVLEAQQLMYERSAALVCLAFTFFGCEK